MKKKHTAITCSTAASAVFLTHTHTMKIMTEEGQERRAGK